jgi:uncharacterized protein YqhQ
MLYVLPDVFNIPQAILLHGIGGTNKYVCMYVTAVRNCEETIQCLTLKKYCTGQAKMQKWQKVKAQLLVFPAKYHVTKAINFSAMHLLINQ